LPCTDVTPTFARGSPATQSSVLVRSASVTQHWTLVFDANLQITLVSASANRHDLPLCHPGYPTNEGE
jgi:hypothetical protein